MDKAYSSLGGEVEYKHSTDTKPLIHSDNGYQERLKSLGPMFYRTKSV